MELIDFNTIEGKTLNDEIILVKYQQKIFLNTLFRISKMEN